uniref:Uncharacterized protein n=1 Tax=Rhizophora mucronata TaxID=61149 RepID=A0A2P2PVY0_RHIMU
MGPTSRALLTPRSSLASCRRESTSRCIFLSLLFQKGTWCQSMGCSLN